MVKELSPDFLAELDGPMGVGNIIDVDTTQPVAIPTLATTVTRLLTTAYDLTP